MQIKGADGYSHEMIRDEIERGGRLVIYLYCVSIFVMTFKRGTAVHFIRAGQSPVARGLPFTFVTLLFGWWGIPWGPIYSIESLFKNFCGGVDVTDEVLASITPREPASYSSAASSSPTDNHPNSPARAPLPPRKPAFTFTPKIIGIGIASLVALVFGIFAISSHQAAQNLSVAVVNGLTTRASIKINDQNVVVSPLGYQLIKVPEGDIQIAATAVTSAETIHIETGFWSRLFSPQILVINPDRVAMIENFNVIYRAKNSQENYDFLIDWKLLTNKSHYVFAEPDYAFVTPPENHSLPQHAKFLKQTCLAVINLRDIDDRLHLIKENLDAAALQTYAKQLATLNPDSPEVPKAVIAQLPIKDAFALIETFIPDRPLRVEWHRAYQDIAPHIAPEIDLQARYSELIAKDSDDGKLHYLLGRVEDDTVSARRDYTLALSSPQPCPHAHIGLGRLDISAMNFKDALAHYEAARSAGLNEGNIVHGRCESLLALRRYDELLADIAQRRKASPHDLNIVVEQIQATAASPSAKPADFDKILQPALARYDTDATPEQKKKVRTYLNATIAYATGDEAASARLLATLDGPRNLFRAAICRRDHTAAQLAVKENPNLPVSYHLSLYLVASQARDTDAADIYWTRALDSLAKADSQHKPLIEQLAGRTPFNPETLRKAELSSDEKALFFASLGLQKPAQRAALFALSAEQNYLLEFPHLLIDSVIRSAPQTTSL